MKLKVSFNVKSISAKDIVLQTGIIISGEPFELIDAYKERNLIFIGIKTSLGIEEAGFGIPNGIKIKNRKQVRSFVESFIMPYFANATYSFYRCISED